MAGDEPRTQLSGTEGIVERDDEGTHTRSDWLVPALLVAAVAVWLALCIKVLPELLVDGSAFEDDADRETAINDVRGTLLQVTAGVGLLATAYVGFRRLTVAEKEAQIAREQLAVAQRHGHDQLAIAQGQLATAQDGQITERYTRAIQQLGAEEAAIRLGGIYALERIANDSEQDLGTAVEVLSAFVRDSTRDRPSMRLPGGLEGSIRPLSTEEQAALTVLGRLPGAGSTRVDLTGTELTGADLHNAILVGAKLRTAPQGEVLSTITQEPRVANLTAADLSGADLTEADLTGANLTGAVFSGANLSSAVLRRVDLFGADLTEANLSCANLRGAKLTHHGLLTSSVAKNALRLLSTVNPHLREQIIDADLTGADLTGADLTGAALPKNFDRDTVLYDETTVWP